MDIDPEDSAFVPIWQQCHPFAAISFERGLAVFRAIRYLHQNFLLGDFVAINHLRADSLMIAMKTLQHFGIANRQFRLLDQPEGPTEACPLGEGSALDALQHAFALTGYDPGLITFVAAPLSEAADQLDGHPIAMLMLANESSDSAREALDELFPRLIDEGVLIVDHCGQGQVARRAVDEFFDDCLRSGQSRPYAELIDQTARLVIKPAQRATQHPSVRHDWLSPSLKRANLISKFPEMIERDPAAIDWPYLRKAVPHIWRVDTRSHRLPDTGAISVEEAELLYNNALAFAGLRGLEVGCHFGWSTAHLVLAGLVLDVVDPALCHDDQHDAVRDSLSRVAGGHSARLWPAFSPGILPAVHGGSGDYSFAFIDGYHEGDAPRRDAEAVVRLCASSACVMFHDLTSPFVAAGLSAMAKAGWNTGYYNTMQIVGIAWRGDFTPVAHHSDPQAAIPDLAHLARHQLLSTAAHSSS